MAVVDYCVLALYFVGLLYIGYAANKKQNDIDDYYVGGRNVGTLSLMTLWLSSWVGGASIVGTAEKSYQVGISSLWYTCSLFVGFLVFAWTFAGRVKKLGDKHNHLTYPDIIEQRYDSKARMMSTITTILAYIGYVASQLLSAAFIINSITGLSTGMSFLIATTVTIVYTAIGGFFAVERTDMIQAFLVFFGLSMIAVPLTGYHLGDISTLVDKLPAEHFGIGSWGWGTIAALFCSTVMTFFTSMDSYTRCYAAKDARSARNGTVLAGLLVLVISGSICFLGMSAKAIIPETDGGTTALIALIMYLFPAGIKGLMLVAILSALMSTADSCILVASANITRDIYQRFINPDASEKKILRLSIMSTAAVGISGALIGWFFKDVMSLMLMTFTVNSAGLFIPTIGIFLWKWATPRAAFWSMSLSLVTVVGWYIGQAVAPDASWFAIDPLWPGLAVSVGVFFSLSFARKRAGNMASAALEAPSTD